VEEAGRPGRIQRIPCDRGDAGLICTEAGQTLRVAEAMTDRSCAKLENSCHSVTSCQGGSGSEGTD